MRERNFITNQLGLLKHHHHWSSEFAVGRSSARIEETFQTDWFVGDFIHPRGLFSNIRTNQVKVPVQCHVFMTMLLQKALQLGQKFTLLSWIHSKRSRFFLSGACQHQNWRAGATLHTACHFWMWLEVALSHIAVGLKFCHCQHHFLLETLFIELLYCFVHGWHCCG